MNVDEAAGVFTDPRAYADNERFYAATAVLRRESPVHRVDHPRFLPFWAITRHDDVMEIARDSQLWINAPRPALGPRSQREGAPEDIPIRALVQMDAPDHPVYRHISADWFKPAGVRKLADRIAELAKRYVDQLAEFGGECDFFQDIAANYPLYVIMSLLGLPEEDFPRMLKLTQELFGANDADLARNTENSAFMETMLDFFNYFQKLITDRRANPTDDLASVIANATPRGELIGELEAIGYYVLIATAGHDTTSSALAGGLHALLQYPDQWRRLADDPGLVPTAFEEMIRWVSPVKQFMRTATADTSVRGVPIAKGESVLLSYPSANRDEDVFEHPDRFDVGRSPNRHVAFGFGAHYCLGTHLARLEGRALYAELVPRIREIELAGPVEYMETLFVGGPKKLPIRFKMA
ncbi:cytochrome P450 [Frankia sp. CNm7]|uniref:Cytochrome P450 n=1 Tax=Frankia nepalensis TaxID=1836974 RepID=A0A937RGJ5_9ACTN|nr:cytochrome P450 [Frankia nepalensis]MBL7495847.1 cytochrome P450 [Frankia nepalensis]MBL7509923.1 cytochrome P450 [Frankia nepalensis]MBL7523700.1 cytochrome P450 [Frankia nepalensis]MBL7629682.1 cytochrome P450 [Frankia nepalensis]